MISMIRLVYVCPLSVSLSDILNHKQFFISSVVFVKLTRLCISLENLEINIYWKRKMAEVSLPIDNRVLVALTNKVKRTIFLLRSFDYLNCISLSWVVITSLTSLKIVYN